jgi:hypothetical protein
LTLGSNPPVITAVNSALPASQATTKNKTSQGRDITTATISKPSMAHLVDELKLPPRLNLLELGPHQSERIKALKKST